MFLSILKKSEVGYTDSNATNEGYNIYKNNAKVSDSQQTQSSIKNKINFLAKVSKMQRVLREEHENILKIKAYNDNRLPPGMLLNGKAAIKNFLDCKIQDAENEKLPKKYRL